MDLQHGYFCTANSRLTLFSDETRWAIVFEKNGYANRGLRIELELNFFGNCLRNLDWAGGGVPKVTSCGRRRRPAAHPEGLTLR